MFTVVLLDGTKVKRAIGRFASEQEAYQWAIKDGWDEINFRIVPFHD